jgi:hypothetical protein
LRLGSESPQMAFMVNLGYLHVMVGLGFHGKYEVLTTSDSRKVYSSTIMGNCGLTRDIAEGTLRSGSMDLASFGRLYLYSRIGGKIPKQLAFITQTIPLGIYLQVPRVTCISHFMNLRVQLLKVPKTFERNCFQTTNEEAIHFISLSLRFCWHLHSK